MYTYICDITGRILCNTLPNELHSEMTSCTQECEYKLCPIRNQAKRHGKKRLANGTIYLCTYDSSITNKIFLRHLSLCETLLPQILELRTNCQNQEAHKIDRLEHNIVTYHKKISEELDTILPLDYLHIQNWREAIASITQHLKDNSSEVALSLLHILKDIKLIKAELEIYDLFTQDAIKLNFGRHEIHRVINLAMQAFWIDFIQQKIMVNIGPCHDQVLIDYPSFSVVLGHIFDNAAKYALRNTPINITFESNASTIKIDIHMTSIAIQPDEIELLFTEQYSGYWATRAGLNGHGIGMYYIKKLTELNNGTVDFIPGTRHKLLFESIPYADNRIVITLQLIN